MYRLRHVLPPSSLLHPAVPSDPTLRRFRDVLLQPRDAVAGLEDIVQQLPGVGVCSLARCTPFKPSSRNLRKPPPRILQGLSGVQGRSVESLRKFLELGPRGVRVGDNGLSVL